MGDPFYALPPDLADDIDAYEGDVRRFLSGELPAPVFRAKRVPRGVYEQRENGTYMVRVRVAGGTLTSSQAERLAALSRQFGNGLLHVTTRQDVQLHDIAIGDTPAIMRRLMAVGLTSKGGGGNTVRNVTACPLAGICPSECFDVTPLAHAITEYLIPLVGSYNLPRKFKIAASGCAADCALAQVMDLGFLADVRDDQPGFRVFAGGGMGAHSRIADLLLDWVPVADAIRITEAVRRLFDQFGNRRNKHRARLRFVFEEMGLEAFRTHFQREMVRVAQEGVPRWQGRVAVNPDRSRAPAGPPGAQHRAGIRYLPHRQDGFAAVPLQLPLGFLPADDLARLGELASRFSGERGLRATPRQGLLMRSVETGDLAALAAELRQLSTDVLSSSPLERFVVCAGASTCRLGLCLARNAARACAEQLGRGAVTADTLAALEIHINGCPNACGQQPIGPLGFFGVAQRVDGRLLPAYRITLGGRCGAKGARLGIPVGQIPARALPDFVSELARDFQRGGGDGEGFGAYFDRMGQAHFAGLAERWGDVPRYVDRPEFYRDFGADEDFSLAGRGAGECGAGVFDLIHEDLRAAQKAEEAFAILLPAARALLITQGVDTQDPDGVFREFEKHFVDRGLVSEEFRGLLTRARGHAQGWQDALRGAEDAAGRLLERVTLLYSTLDANLQFHPPEEHEERVLAGDGPSSGDSRPAGVSGDGLPPPLPSASKAQGGEELDLCGVACPMNFVKAKLKLETMNVGEALAMILDDGEPIRNVPASFRAEGQAVEEAVDLGHGHWRVVVRKRRG